MNKKSELTFEEVNAILLHNASTGQLFWKERDISHFPHEKEMKRWNARYAGRGAFTAMNYGYRRGLIYRKDYRAHRVLWLLHTGSWPIGQIDHINGIRDDNRFSNLRDVTPALNARNACMRKDNKSGVTGVCWCKRVSLWEAYIHFDGKEYKIGHFDLFDDAVEARKRAEQDYGFHENHGRFA